jgi:hypothetical protein
MLDNHMLQMTISRINSTMPERGRAHESILPLRLLLIGLFLFVFGVTWLMSSGRIDIIDGQWRFEIANSLLRAGETVIRDPVLQQGTLSVKPWIAPDGSYHYVYGLGASLSGLFFMEIGKFFGVDDADILHHLFGIANPLFHALTSVILFLFFRSFRLTPKRAFTGALAYAFCSLGFAVATTSFDHPQRGFWLLLAFYLAYVSQRNKSAVYAFLAGLSGAVTVHYNEPMVIMFPFAALLFFSVRPYLTKDSLRLLFAFVFGALLVLLLWGYFNELRFGDFFAGRFGNSISDRAGAAVASHNVVVGIIGLFASPGKGLIFYGPPSVLALGGFVRMWRSHKILVVSIAAPSLIYIVSIASRTYWGGDWCWGPRYLLVILPLLFLGWARLRAKRTVVIGIAAVGLAVQILGNSLDMHRFYFERYAAANFYDFQPDFHFENSMLFSRPGEILESIQRHSELSLVQNRKAFRMGPYPESNTYSIFGTNQPVAYFRVFWYPRPWPLWTSMLRQEERRPAYNLLLAIAVGVTLIGMALLWRQRAVLK